jgi:hypothetical protein
MNLLVLVLTSNRSIDCSVHPAHKGINWAAIHIIWLVGGFMHWLGRKFGLSNCCSQPFWLGISPLVYAQKVGKMIWLLPTKISTLDSISSTIQNHFLWYPNFFPQQNVPMLGL